MKLDMQIAIKGGSLCISFCQTHSRFMMDVHEELSHEDAIGPAAMPQLC
jgi:hypothetical protein